MEGLRGQLVAQICQEHQISQSMYYTWRDQLLTHMDKAFEVKKADQREIYQQKKVEKMKQIIADLTIELKKSDEEEWH